MIKRLYLSVVILSSMLVLTAGSVFAMCPGCKNNQPCAKCAKMEEKHFDKMAKELSLTDVQKQQVKAHREKHMATIRDIIKQSREKKEELIQELQKPDTDKTKVDALKNDLKELEAKHIEGMIDRISEMKQILTPEQQKIMNANMKKRHEKMKEHIGKKTIHGMGGHTEGDTGADCPTAPDK
jgi:Spy/CpxP family protein refolding chaperone